MSKKCKAYSRSGLGLELPDSRKAFYAGWDAALEQQQEPVAWMWEKSNYPESRTVEVGLLFKQTDSYGDVEWTPLYTSPPASKPWVGLTQQEIDIAFDDTQKGGGFNEFAYAIETKLKEKNT